MLNDIQKRIGDLAEDPDWVRLNLVFALFCKVDPARLIEPGLWLLERWRAFAGTSLSWALAGKNASTIAAVNKNTVGRLEKEIRSAASNDLTAFRFQGPEAFAPSYRMVWLTSSKASDRDNARTNLIELTLPIPELSSGWKEASDFFREVSEHFPYDTGYAAPALVFGDDAAKVEAGQIIGPLSLRHPGLDVPNNATTSYFLGTMSRGARWVTFLSDANAEKIGLRQQATGNGGTEVARTSNGWIITASPEPEIGDVNRQKAVPHLASVARLLEPITFYGDKNLKMLLADKLEFVERWEKRFASPQVSGSPS